MQPITIIIEGDYYDSQIYSGNLYLWTVEGDIITIEWDKFLEHFISYKLEESLRFIAYAAFIDCNFLYKNEWQLFFKDPKFKRLFLNRLDELRNLTLTFNLRDFKGYYKKSKNPFIFPHADSLIYYNTMYVGSRSGLYVSPIKVKIQPGKKIWDGGVINMAASDRTLALSSGQNGVYEYYPDIYLDDRKKNYRKQSSEPSNYVNWMYGSLFSSFYGQGYILQFEEEDKKEKGKKKDATQSAYHEQSHRYVAEDLFSTEEKSSSQMIWGIRDKLCLANARSIFVVKYVPHGKTEFNNIGSINWNKLASNKNSEIISAGSGYFGYVIETDEGLLVIGSNFNNANKKDYLWLDGEPTNWRLFSNSKNYTNQLHVVYDNNISIFSFNQDYDINQKTKLVGISK